MSPESREPIAASQRLRRANERFIDDTFVLVPVPGQFRMDWSMIREGDEDAPKSDPLPSKPFQD